MPILPNGGHGAYRGQSGSVDRAARAHSVAVNEVGRLSSLDGLFGHFSEAIWEAADARVVETWEALLSLMYD